MNQELQNYATNTLARFAQLIEEAPADIVPQDTPDAPESILTQNSHRHHTIRQQDGWGIKYLEPIELHGDQWFAAFEKARPIVESGGLLALFGTRGPGKTQMAAELAKTGKWPNDAEKFIPAYGGVGKMIQGRTALYRRAMDIFLDLRHAAKNHVQSSEKDVLATLADVGLLVIDEFQERGESEWENRILKNLLDKRYAAGRATIIIANLTRKELMAALGESIIDRAMENGKSIEFTWESYRKPQ